MKCQLASPGLSDTMLPLVIHLKQAKTFSEAMFGFQVSLQLAWHHASNSQLRMTDDALELRAVDIPGPTETFPVRFVFYFSSQLSFTSCSAAPVPTSVHSSQIIVFDTLN